MQNVKTMVVAGASAAVLISAQAGFAQPLEYTVGDVAFEGYVAHPEGTPRGTVLIVHDWDGVNDHEIARADALAQSGFVAVAIDLFGRDTVLDGMEDYRRETGALYADRDAFRARIEAAARAVSQLDDVPARMVITGYCFGGAAALEAARAGMDMAGFVSFHGGLDTPEGQDYSATDAPVLVLHGSADPVSDMADLANLMDELQAADVAHEAQIFGGARHSFTVEGSNDWDADANNKAHAALARFLDQIF